MKYITNFYKNLFGRPEETQTSIKDLELKISEEENKNLMAPFPLDEIKEVVLGVKKNKSPGPDGFPADFYQEFWDLVKWDIKALVEEFAKGNILDLTMVSLP